LNLLYTQDVGGSSPSSPILTPLHLGGYVEVERLRFSDALYICEVDATASLQNAINRDIVVADERIERTGPVEITNLWAERLALTGCRKNDATASTTWWFNLGHRVGETAVGQPCRVVGKLFADLLT
jgi:hypothetical protein